MKYWSEVLCEVLKREQKVVELLSDGGYGCRLRGWWGWMVWGYVERWGCSFSSLTMLKKSIVKFENRHLSNIFQDRNKTKCHEIHSLDFYFCRPVVDVGLLWWWRLEIRTLEGEHMCPSWRWLTSPQAQAHTAFGEYQLICFFVVDGVGCGSGGGMGERWDRVSCRNRNMVRKLKQFVPDYFTFNGNIVSFLFSM